MIDRALLVGINSYDSQDRNIPNLQGCIHDVKLIQSTLKSVYQLPDNRIMTILDEDATFFNISQALNAWSDSLQNGDRLFFYFSGHGVQVPDTSSNRDEDMDQAIVPYDFSKVRVLLDDLLSYHFSHIPDGAKATVILDCCHAGGMRSSISFNPEDSDYDPGQARTFLFIEKNEYSSSELDKLKELKEHYAVEKGQENLIMLTACQPHEQAWEQSINGRRQGLFTTSLCHDLQQYGAGISARQLIDHAHGTIYDFGKDQSPRLIGKEEFFDMPLFD